MANLLYIDPNRYSSSELESLVTIVDKPCNLLYFSAQDSANQNIYLQIYDGYGSSSPILTLNYFGLQYWQGPVNGIRMRSGLIIAASSEMMEYIPVADTSHFFVLWI